MARLKRDDTKQKNLIALGEEIAELRQALAGLDLQQQAPALGVEIQPQAGNLFDQINAQIRSVKEAEGAAIAAELAANHRQATELLLLGKIADYEKLQASIAKDNFDYELALERSARLDLIDKFNSLSLELVELGTQIFRLPTDRIRENQGHANVIGGTLQRQVFEYDRGDFLMLRSIPLYSGSLTDALTVAEQMQRQNLTSKVGEEPNCIVTYEPAPEAEAQVAPRKRRLSSGLF